MSENKKGLLNENTIRRFMKLAEIDTLSYQFVGSISEKYELDEAGMPYNREDDAEEEVEEGMGMGPYARDDAEPAFDMADEEAGAEDPEDALPPEPAAEAPAAAGDAEAIFTALVDKIIALAADHGVEMSRDAGGDEEAAPEMDMEPAADDLDMADEPMEEGAHEDDELEEGAHEEDEDEMVAEITRRVSARLQKESRNERLAEELTEKIMTRLKENAQK